MVAVVAPPAAVAVAAVVVVANYNVPRHLENAHAIPGWRGEVRVSGVMIMFEISNYTT